MDRDTATTREFWNRVGSEIKTARDCIMPLLDGWLDASGKSNLRVTVNAGMH